MLSDLVLYHWSPTSRRRSIVRSGLLPGSFSIERDWRPPYICFADDALLAKALVRHRVSVDSWDLWAVRPQDLQGWELIFDTYPSSGRHFIKEYRVYHRVFKRHVHFVATSAG